MTKEEKYSIVAKIFNDKIFKVHNLLGENS